MKNLNPSEGVILLSQKLLLLVWCRWHICIAWVSGSVLRDFGSRTYVTSCKDSCLPFSAPILVNLGEPASSWLV